MLLFVLVTAYAAWRTQRDRPRVLRLAMALAVLYPIQVVVGGLQVLTQLADWTQTLHVALGAIIWANAAALATSAYYEARVAVPAGAGVPAAGAGDGGDGRHGRRRPPAAGATRSGPTSP